MTAGSPSRGLQDTPPLLLLALGGLRSPKVSPSGTGKGEETPETGKNEDPARWTAPVNVTSHIGSGSSGFWVPCPVLCCVKK